MLNQKVQEQKKISRAIIKAQEQEGVILAELHDNITQILAGAKIYLSTAGTKDAKVKEAIKYPVELIDNSLKRYGYEQHYGNAHWRDRFKRACTIIA